MKRGEILATVAVAALGVGGLAIGAEQEAESLPGSYQEQIQSALGQAGIHAEGVVVNTEKGRFTFNLGSGANEERCDGKFSSANDIDADIASGIDCQLVKQGPTIFPAA